MAESPTPRPIPVHLLFADGQIDAAPFAAIRAEAERSNQDLWDLSVVSALPTVARWISDLRPEGQDPHTVRAYSALLFFSMHVVSDGGGVWIMSESVGRWLATDGPEDAQPWSAQAPSEGGYVQLPHNLFWVQTGSEESEGVAEPVDGIFWARSPRDDGLWVMLAAGLRPGRPGFSAVVLDLLPAGDIGRWADEKMREDGEDFENTLPGGDLAGFLTMATSGEALKLLARAWRHVEVYGSAELNPSDSDLEAQSTALRYHRLSPQPDAPDA